MNKRMEQKKFDELMKNLRKGGFKYVPRDEKEIDWSKYDEAQINEINDMLILIRDAVDGASLRLDINKMLKNTGPGRPRNHPADLAKAILMQQYFSVSNRVTEGLVLLFREKLRMKNTFSYKTIERAYEDPLATLILRELFSMTHHIVKDKEHAFSPDGTGLCTSMKQNWENDHRNGKKRGYEKMIAMVGDTYKLFSSVTFADEPQDNESPYFEQLLAETAESYEKIDIVSADAAYLSRYNCDLIAGVGAIPRIYPKRNITLRKKGSKAWIEMLLSFIRNPQDWLRDYHPRSISESAYSVFKRDFPIPLRKRIKLRRKQEAFTRACDYNLKRLCYLRYLEGLVVKVW